jgi:hypothetical protein
MLPTRDTPKKLLKTAFVQKTAVVPAADRWLPLRNFWQ